MTYKSLYEIFVSSDSKEFNDKYYTRFNCEGTLHIPLEINKNPAFFFYSPDITNLCAKIREYDVKVRKAFENLPLVAQTQYIKKSLIDEIEFTNQIEGVISTRKEINEIIESIRQPDGRLDGIVNKYQKLINIEQIPFKSVLDIRKAYDEMFYEEIKLDDPKNLPDGEYFRQKDVFIYNNKETPIHRGVSPETKIIQYMNEALSVLNNENIDVLIRVGIFHYLFGYIHPFYDGNGRINRFISSYYLSSNLTKIIGYRLSMTIKENLSQYLEAFKHTNDVRNKGDVSYFVYEFLLIVLKAYQKTELYALKKGQELEKYDKKIKKTHFNPKVRSLLFVLVQCEIFSEFGLSVADLAKITHFKHATCSKHIKEIRDTNIIKILKKGKRVFYTINLDELNKY